MTWNYAYTPQIWPLAFTILMLIALAIYSWRHRNVPGALPLTVALLIGALWSAGIGLEAAAVDTATKISWVKFQAAWVPPVATVILCFVLEYAWPGRWLTRRNLAVLSIPCLIAFGLILTNNFHHLVWQGFVYDGEVIPINGPANWAFLAYAYIFRVVNLVVLVWLFMHSPQQRWPVAIMLTGQFATAVVFALGTLRVIQSVLPVEIIAFWFQIPMYAIALFGFRIFDPVPMARQMAIDQMRDGMLVVDRNGRVASLNPAMVAILGRADKQVTGKPVGEILPFDAVQADESTGESEISLERGGETRNYLLSASEMKDFRGLPIGQLLLLHDVTEQRRSQAQLLEQQRALATLNERERLARELHDGLGQVLGYTGLRMEATRKLIADGKLATADEQLVRLENIVADAHADVREHILDLRTMAGGERPFFATLQHYLDGFLKNYGIRVDLSVGDGVKEGVFPPEAQVQLFRIIQEAFSNARKHAQASRMQLSFEIDDSRVIIRIQDNGKGFNPAEATREGHFGLHIMRERVEQLGGTLEINSATGMGTCVTVVMPVERKLNH